MRLGKLKYIAVGALLSFSLASGVSGAIAWFNTRAVIDNQSSMKGVSEGAYFAYGDGTSGSPFGIKDPRHLYNLAWLQYLGFIPIVSATNSAETYFVLDGDIDMTGWTIPPIGTESNPFLGYFNGNNKTISNLVVSNDVTDFEHKPDAASSFASPHILGLFGVVGTYNGVGTDYSKATSAVKDVTLESATITCASGTSDILAGVVAGYVDGAISNVGIKSSGFDFDEGVTNYSSGKDLSGNGFSNVSDYGSIGFAEEAYTGTYGSRTTELRDNVKSTKGDLVVQDSGDTQGWGGSIDMKTMYTGLLNVWNTYSSSSSGIATYPSEVTRTYNLANELVAEEVTATKKIPDTSSWDGDYSQRRYYQYEQKSGSDVTASYTFAHRHTSDGTGLPNYMYLYGDTTNTISGGASVTRIQETSGTVIHLSRKVDSTTYYLVYNSGLSYTTDSSSASDWVIKNGKIFYVDNSGSTSSYVYLYKNGTSLGTTISSSSATTFTYDSTNKSYYVTESSTNYYLSFKTSSKSWVFVNDYQGKQIYSGTHYLTASSWGDNQAVADTTEANAPVWTIPANGSSGYITTVQNDTTYYLRYNNSTSMRVTTSSSSASSWTVSSDGSNITYANGNTVYSITYDGGWTFDTSALQGYRISNTAMTHYLSASGKNITDSTSASSATIWTKNGSYFYYTYNNKNYYIAHYSSWGNHSIELNTSNSSAFALNSSGDSLTYEHNGFFGTSTYYVLYSSGWTTDTTSTQLVFTPVYSDMAGVSTKTATVACDKDTMSSDAGSSYNVKSVSTENATYTTKPTYFPLRQETTGSTPNGIPKETNTGYVTSGANDSLGDIRVSRYGKSSSLPSGLNTVYTRNDSGNSVVIYGSGVDKSSDYSKFTDSKSQLQTVLDSDSSYVYGLHFVGSTISYDRGSGSYSGNSVYAEQAIVNGTSYSDYELPKDCIDFNLKEKGFVNFFAGTYYPGNDSFFSLHEIARTSSSVSLIREIDEIYSAKSTVSGYKTFSYVYKYTDGSYSIPYKYSMGNKVTLSGGAYTDYSVTDSLDSTNYNSTPIFKTSWIKTGTLTNNVAYYFEVPVNAGEYGLSSVSGGQGAYLMYLDIGANASKVNRTNITEYIKEVITSFAYPLGVAVVASGISASDTNSYCVRLGSAYDGTVTLSRASEAAGTATYTDATNKIKISFVSQGLTVVDGSGGDIDVISGGESVVETSRVTFFDYATASGAYTKIIVTEQKIDGVVQDRTKESYQWDDTNSAWVLDTNNVVKLYSDGGITITDLDDVTISTSSIASSDPMLKFSSIYLGSGLTVTFTYALGGALGDTGSGSFYDVSGYLVTISCVDAENNVVDVDIKILSYNASTATLTFQIGTETVKTTVTAQGQTFTVPSGS